MSQVEQIPKTYESAVTTLAQWHASQDPAEMEIYSFDDPLAQRVQLLEVSDTFAALGRVAVFPFSASGAFPFRSGVAQVTRAEWLLIRTNALKLPEGWNLRDARKVYP